MTGAGIFFGDFTVVDRGRAFDGNIVLALHSREMLSCKRWRRVAAGGKSGFSLYSDCRRTSLGGVGRHHAQHPHAVTVAGSIAFVGSNNCERVFQPELRASRSSCCRAVTRHALPIAVASP
jgi:hypothetical protein